MHRCTTPEQVASAVAEQRARVVAVDGFQASGKTTLARALGAALGCKVISADQYLHRNRDAFFPHLDLKRLAEDVETAGTCILEGVCCLQVLRAIGGTPNCLVYVKRMAASRWVDEDALETYTTQGLPPLTEPIDPLAKSLRALWEEVARYHTQFSPHVVAQVVYERGAA